MVPGDADAAQRKRIVKMKLEADKRRAEEERKRAEFDVKYAKRSTQGIPEVVTDRMLKKFSKKLRKFKNKNKKWK